MHLWRRSTAGQEGPPAAIEPDGTAPSSSGKVSFGSTAAPANLQDKMMISQTSGQNLILSMPVQQRSSMQQHCSQRERAAGHIES